VHGLIRQQSHIRKRGEHDGRIGKGPRFDKLIHDQVGGDIEQEGMPAIIVKAEEMLEEQMQAFMFDHRGPDIFSAEFFHEKIRIHAHLDPAGSHRDSRCERVRGDVPDHTCEEMSVEGLFQKQGDNAASDFITGL
ncbi:MAG TPA: hypothetical protein QF695_16190, partial [Arenicellales bacterium]|nr:hypothetical protein [Arenicellales bacterium]